MDIDDASFMNIKNKCNDCEKKEAQRMSHEIHTYMSVKPRILHTLAFHLPQHSRHTVQSEL